AGDADDDRVVVLQPLQGAGAAVLTSPGVSSASRECEHSGRRQGDRGTGTTGGQSHDRPLGCTRAHRPAALPRPPTMPRLDWFALSVATLSRPRMESANRGALRYRFET